MSDICKFVKMKKLALSLFIDLYVGKSMINCLSLCVSGGLSVCLFRISNSLPVFLSYLSAFVYSKSVICKSIDRSVCTLCGCLTVGRSTCLSVCQSISLPSE